MPIYLDGRLFALFLAPQPGSEPPPDIEAESGATAPTVGGESIPLGMAADGLEIELPDSVAARSVAAIKLHGVREREAARS